MTWDASTLILLGTAAAVAALWLFYDAARIRAAVLRRRRPARVTVDVRYVFLLGAMEAVRRAVFDLQRDIHEECELPLERWEDDGGPPGHGRD